MGGWSPALAAHPYVLALSASWRLPLCIGAGRPGPVQAVLAAIKFFRYNKFDVIILWLVWQPILSLEMISGAVSTARRSQPGSVLAMEWQAC